MSEVSHVRTVHEPARETPVAAEVDVLVAGGGPAGLGAAIAAAREGASTLLVERNAFLGGAATANLVSKLSQHRAVLYGISGEIVDELLRRRAAVAGRVINFDPEAFKKVALDLVQDAGARLLLYSWVVVPIVEEGAVQGVFVENKCGRQALLARTVIDCTGDADIAAGAGVPFVKGREGDGKMRPVVLLFRVGNVDFHAMVDYARRHPDQFSPDPNRQVNDIERGVVRMWGFFDLVEEASRRGELPPDFHCLELEGVDVERGICYINGTEVYEVDGTNAWDLTRAEIEARNQISMFVDFVRKHIPGCERASVIDTAAGIGVRETRHIRGEHILSEEDCVAGRPFEDRVVRVSTHLAAPGVAVHNPDRKEGSADDQFRTMIAEERKFYIPYRCLVPQGAERLLVAGRSISQTHDADGWTRSEVWCMGMGQAAGTAAALAAADGTTVRTVDIGRVQQLLRAQGVPLDEAVGQPVPEPGAS
ncbi:MAG: FAD-dependent oxidoreductase [Bacteroidetes bacterium]|nr:FAD-dependent oxidoreductase [Bacteroidota bacterium]MCL5025153.1 FAD-dependent oxidoreductase [Chloroflexota bacterium]